MIYNLKDIFGKVFIWSTITAILSTWWHMGVSCDALAQIWPAWYALVIFGYSQIALPINLVISYSIIRAYYKLREPVFVADLSCNNLYKIKNEHGLSSYGEYNSQVQLGNDAEESFAIAICAIIILIINWNLSSFITNSVLNGVI